MRKVDKQEICKEKIDELLPIMKENYVDTSVMLMS